MNKWLDVNPKIKAAALTALAAGILAVVNATAQVYPQDALVNILYTVAPVIAGYLTKA